MADSALQPLMDGTTGKKTQQQGRCLTYYRVAVIVLLLAVLGLLIADVVLWYTTEKDSCAPAVEAVYDNHENTASLTQHLPETCGDLRPIPRLEDDSYELKQVQVIIRHGDRVQWQSKECWPNSTAVWNCSLSMASTPSFNRTAMKTNVFRLYRHLFQYGVEPILGDCSVGQLTMKGYQQQLQNGMFLRKAYVDSGFLTRSFNHSDIFIRSDDESRTLQSAESLMYGMYPPSTLGKNQAEVIDIHTRDKSVDILGPNPTLCPVLTDYESNAKQSKAYQEHDQSVTEPLLDQLSSLLKTNLSVDDVDPVMDCFVVHTCHGMSLPTGVTTELFQKTVDEQTWQFNYTLSYPSIQSGTKANIGFFIKDLYQRMLNGVEGKAPSKFYLYSGHDVTLLPLLIGFQQKDIKWPPYASLMAIELYRPKRSGHYAVRVVYNGQPLHLPFCGTTSASSLCEWEVFKEYIESLIPNSEFCDA